MTTKLVNVKEDSSWDFYIGRTNQIPDFGNPFIIGPDGTREDVIRKHKNYLKRNKYLQQIVQLLKDKVLGCYCYPLSCHGDNYIQFLDNPEKFWEE